MHWHSRLLQTIGLTLLFCSSWAFTPLHVLGSSFRPRLGILCLTKIQVPGHCHLAKAGNGRVQLSPCFSLTTLSLHCFVTSASINSQEIVFPQLAQVYFGNVFLLSLNNLAFQPLTDGIQYDVGVPLMPIEPAIIFRLSVFVADGMLWKRHASISAMQWPNLLSCRFLLLSNGDVINWQPSVGQTTWSVHNLQRPGYLKCNFAFLPLPPLLCWLSCALVSDHLFLPLLEPATTFRTIECWVGVDGTDVAPCLSFGYGPWGGRCWWSWVLPLFWCRWRGGLGASGLGGWC